jgi:hypothetical protein
MYTCVLRILDYNVHIQLYILHIQKQWIKIENFEYDLQAQI